MTNKFLSLISISLYDFEMTKGGNLHRVMIIALGIPIGSLIIVLINLLPTAQSSCAKQLDFASSHANHLQTLMDNACRTFFIMPPQEDIAPASTVISRMAADDPAKVVNPFQLHSKPNSSNILYLDFDGMTWQTGNWWIGAYGISVGSTSPGFDLDGNPLTFIESEKSIIAQIWANVSEDFSVFDVDVTTERPSGSRETLFNSKGAYALILTDPVLQTGCGCGGIAHLDTFGSGQTFLHPALNFSKFGDYYAQGWDVAEIISHEIGHNLGLAHDGQTMGTNPPPNDWKDEYYTGHGAWTPIMGAGRGRGISHWSYGGYPYARTTFSQYSQDDFATMARHIPIVQDEAGNSLGSARTITTNDLKTVFEGLITTRTDVDVFKITVGNDQKGNWKFSANAAPFSPNLDIELKLFKESEANLFASINPSTPTRPVYGLLTTGMSASISTSLAAGTYYLRIDGVGQGSLLATGYDDYSSVGNYSLVIEAPNAASSAPTNQSAPVISGTASVGQTLTGTAGQWTGSPTPRITYQWFTCTTAFVGSCTTSIE
jgi:hypothetical protein